MMAVEAVIVIASHEFSDRMVERNVCRLVCGTTSNVHVTAPPMGAPGWGPVGFDWIVSVPRHVPVRNDWGAVGHWGGRDDALQVIRDGLERAKKT